MESEKNLFRVKYRKGLGDQIEVEASSVLEARKLALAEYRRNCTMVDMKPLDAVVSEDVEILA